MKHGSIVAGVVVAGLLAAGSVLVAGEGGGRGKGGLGFGGRGKADLGGRVGGAGDVRGGTVGGDVRGGGAVRERMKERFAQMDANHDGQVTFEEFRAYREQHMREVFDLLDRNDDGVLSRADRLPRQGQGDGEATPAAKAGTDGV